MDLVTHLPPVDGYDAVVVFVDKMTKVTRYAPTTIKCTGEQLARLFFDNVVRHNGLPLSIVSDRDPRMTGNFWRGLMELVGVELRMSSVAHPQTDGQSERAIRTLQESLRAYASRRPSDWPYMLSALEFAYNSAVQESSGMTPFAALYGHQPRSVFDMLVTRSRPRAARVEEWERDLQAVRLLMTAHLQRARARQERWADRARRDVDYHVGDSVRLSTENLRHSGAMDDADKFRLRWIGPFKITELIGDAAVRLALPPTMKCHDVFHVGEIELWRESDRFSDRDHPRPPPVARSPGSSRDDMYEVERIVDCKHVGNRVLYRVRWKGYPPEEDTWEPPGFLEDVRDLIQEYLQRVESVAAHPVQRRSARMAARDSSD